MAQFSFERKSHDFFLRILFSSYGGIKKANGLFYIHDYQVILFFEGSTTENVANN
jgi:hypothetical protein